MGRHSIYLSFIVYILSLVPVSAQGTKTDSLYTLLKKQKEDTNKVNILTQLAFSIYENNPDTAILLSGQALALSEKLSWKKGEAKAYFNEACGYRAKGNYAEAMADEQKALDICNAIGDKAGQANNLRNIGVLYYHQSNFTKSLDYYQMALKIDNETGNKEGQAANYGNIGLICDDQGDYPQALDYYLKALKIYDDLKDKSGQANNLGNIGLVYEDESDFNHALEYYTKALKLCEELGDKEGQAIKLTNMANVYCDQGKYDTALQCYLKSLTICNEQGNKVGQAMNLGNIGTIYSDQRNDYPKALEYLTKALKINQELGNEYGQALNMGNMGALYCKTGKFKEAEDLLKKAISMDSSMGEQNNLIGFETLISQLYDTTGHYQQALYWFKKAKILQDTLFNMDKNKALTRKELTYKFQRQTDSTKVVQDTKDATVAAEAKRQNTIIWTVIAGLLLVTLFAGLIFRSLRITRKQKAVIEVKSKEVEEKNKEILDSITYAKRLQDAILPPLSVIKKYLPDSFLLYRPKDIVAGDFYWMEVTHPQPLLNPPHQGGLGKNIDTSPNGGGEEGAGIILIAACDCTGHGVPGAMVSVVCSNALNRALKEFKIRETGKLLDKVRELVLETFEKSEGEVKDGMDCSFCAINTLTHEIEWSGAYNPLWYIKDGKMNELPADKQPIGKHDKQAPFNTSHLKLSKGDSLYLFTDGYADQFGGPKGKKFKYLQLQQLIVENAKLPMEKQKHILENKLQEWQGQLEQVDDILVIGIRI